MSFGENFKLSLTLILNGLVKFEIYILRPYNCQLDGELNKKKGEWKGAERKKIVMMIKREKLYKHIIIFLKFKYKYYFLLFD